MKKNIEWVISEIEQRVEKVEDHEKTAAYNKGVARGLEISLSLLDQFDKPETLSQAWIDQNHFETENLLEDLYKSDGETIDYTPHIKVIAVQDLQKQNLIAPKQGKVKIESVWAEDIEDAKASGMTLFEAMDWMAIDCDDEEKQDLFARAWLDGYTVEEEQKYVVKIPTNENNDIPYAIVSDSGDIWIDALPSKYKLTEEEIRGLTKGDVLFEHFAVKVEVWDE